MNQTSRPSYRTSNTRISLYIAFLVILSNSFFLVGQSEEDLAHYSLFDNLIGNQNSGIFAGEVYVDRLRDLQDDHKFFETKVFRKGWVAYDGQFYSNPVFNYDIHSAKLLIMDPLEQNSPIIVLDTERITAFMIDDHEFLNSGPDDNEEEFNGFFEILFEGDSLYLLKKHIKKIIKRTDNGVYYKFRDTPDYYIKKADDWFRIKKLKNVVDLFPKYGTRLQDPTDLVKSSKKEDFEQRLVKIVEELNNYGVKGSSE